MKESFECLYLSSKECVNNKILKAEIMYLKLKNISYNFFWIALPFCDVQRCHQVAKVTIVCCCLLLWKTLFYICLRHQVQYLEIFWWCHCNGSKYDRDLKKKDWTCIVRIMHKKCVPLQFHMWNFCDRKPFPCLNLNYSSAIIYNSTLIIERGLSCSLSLSDI